MHRSLIRTVYNTIKILPYRSDSIATRLRDNEIFLHFLGILKHVGTNLCLSISASSDDITLSSCTKDNSLNVWKCHFPLVEQSKTWIERDWAGLKTVSGTKCVSVTSDRRVKAKDCTAYGKNVEEKIFVYGKNLMGVCAVAGM